MRRISIIFLILCFVFIPDVFAQEIETPDEDIAWADEDDVWEGNGESSESYEDEGDDFPEEKKRGGRIKDRRIEVGLVNLNLSLSNNFLTVKDIFKESVVINLDDLKDGLKINLDVGLNPIFFNYNNDDKWGFGISLGVNAYGAIDIAGEMLTFQEARDAKSDIAAAAFVEVGIPVFFRLPIINKLKLKVKPSLFYPIAYVKPDVSYTYRVTDSENIIDFNLSARVYTAFPISDGSSFALTATPGFDLSVGAELPLSEAFGLNRIPLLDFDIGIDFSGIPIVPASMNDYMETLVKVGGEDSIDFFDENTNFDDFFTAEDPTYGKKKINVLRPFKMLVWAEWRPFSGAKLISFIPTAGFSVNPIYVEPNSFEGGIKARLDLLNMFIVTAGVGYHDRLWKNSLDLVLNLRAFELDIGASLRAPTFVESWSGGGFGIAVGLKFGW